MTTGVKFPLTIHRMNFGITTLKTFHALPGGSRKCNLTHAANSVFPSLSDWSWEYIGQKLGYIMVQEKEVEGDVARS